MNKTLFTFFLCLLVTGAFSQQDLTIVLQSQYKTVVSNKAVNINGKTYTTNEEGAVTIPLSGETILKITADNFSETQVAVAEVPADRIVTMDKDFSFKDLLTPMFYIINGGIWLILFIVFAETGLFAGFFLPGDSLLFVSGIYSYELVNTVFPLQNDFLALLLLIAMISFMGIIGNTVGYWFGRRIGPTMYHWKDTLLFKRKYLHQAHDFYEKHGGLAIIGARFLPLVRTFAPIIAGIVQMDKKKFAYYNIVGSFAWVASMVLGGHFLQKWMLSWFGFDLKSHLEVIVLVIVAVTTVPVVYKMFFSKEKSPTLEIGKDIVEEELNIDIDGDGYPVKKKD